MFMVVQRTDTLPEIRTLVNTDHIVSVAPVGGTGRSRLVLSTGEAWEVALPFARAVTLLQAEPEMVEPVVPVGRRDFVDRRQDPGSGAPAEPAEPRRDFVERRRPPV